ncbi:MAG TPA: SDR family NAD(P)-dependent oxidoreductase, partial [Pyrinomonadaceae bacterium]|nr:SDR family NAD(P)-dependent oxidoreductase [Pyrinomonadaceae bacterium]
MEIEGKRVLVTGASRGLGRALVAAFVVGGASEVLAGARKREDLEALRSERVTPVQLDVTSDVDVAALAQRGAVDILINNAGVAGFGNPLTMDFAAIQEEIAVNYFGVLRVTRAIAPGMIAKHDGVIVNV